MKMYSLTLTDSSKLQYRLNLHEHTMYVYIVQRSFRHKRPFNDILSLLSNISMII